MKRRALKCILLASLVVGGAAFQAGCGSGAAALINFGLAAIDFCALTFSPDCTVGPFAPCGIPNVQLLDANGLPTGEVLFDEDDLLLDCPVTFIQPTNDAGG